ncbi:glutathionylspermidine synthase family protein [Desmospora profundinema]|uniref:Glutathionylspermidine synthase n=1 Tax=Desmospora profundinema TaxID=1571184 RepID=A0ABU1IR03_9BACL|nr:glutathionylspermidine synthase family protein [Desmospora profundinema]MDR6226584.1 glutathionylspermidine synthase [Desmospora profundinema]
MNHLVGRFFGKIDQTHDRGYAIFNEVGGMLRREQWLQVENTDVLLRPLFHTAEDLKRLEEDIVHLFQLMFHIPDRLFEGDVSKMCDLLGLNSLQKKVVESTWVHQEVLIGRADLYKDKSGSFKLLEFNVHSSTGGLENAEFNRVLLHHPFFRDFVNEESLSFIDSVDGVAEALWDASIKRGLGNRPKVAIVDWPSTYPAMVKKMDRFAGLLRKRGFDAFSCHLGELDYRDGVLYADSTPVDILYRTFVIDEITETPSLLKPVLEAVRDDRVLLVMSFVAELVGNKGVLAFLSDPRYQKSFNDDERRLIDRFVPWTRFVQPGMTDWNGEQMDITEILLEQQSEMVLKPVCGFGGMGVQLGWCLSPDEWKELVERILNGKTLYVMQKRVHPELEPMLFLTSQGIQEHKVMINWGVFTANGRYNGSFARGTISEGDAVVNVSRGAATGCVFHQN